MIPIVMFSELFSEFFEVEVYKLREFCGINLRNLSGKTLMQSISLHCNLNFKNCLFKLFREYFHEFCRMYISYLRKNNANKFHLNIFHKLWEESDEAAMIKRPEVPTGLVSVSLP